MQPQLNTTQAVILIHAPADHAYARELAAFLELGCDVRCDPEVGLLRTGSGGDDLVDLVEQFPDNPRVLLLSRHSLPARLPLERLDPLLLARPLACVLLHPCPFPPLLQRGGRTFFDLQQKGAHNAARRGLKRWLWQLQSAPDVSPHYAWSADLEDLYAQLADQPGTRAIVTAGERARRFASEAAGEFESVMWIACHERSLVEVTGDLGHQLGLVLDGEEPHNRQRIEETLAKRRCLVILDAPSQEVLSSYAHFGRSSALVTTEPMEIRETPFTFDYARQLVRQRRLAEAYDLFCDLINASAAERDYCAQELVSICEHWGRTDEAARLRLFDHAPSHQMGLFD